MKKQKTIHGVGVNDSTTTVYSTVDGVTSKCEHYVVWQDMLRRCYSASSHDKFPTYHGCTVSDEWLYFSKFREWSVKNKVSSDLFLDKDMIVLGNKVYSESTCAYVPRYVNNCLLGSSFKRGNLPLGVTKVMTKRQKTPTYMAKIGGGERGSRVYLGTYSTPMAAHAVWQVSKIKMLEEVILRFRLEDSFNSRVADSINSVAWGIRNDISAGRETTLLFG